MVAEPLTAPTETQAPTGDVTPELESQLPETTGTDAAPPIQAEASSPESTGSEVEFKVAELPEWQEAISDVPEQPKPALPGEDLATATARAQQGRAAQYAQILQGSQQEVVQRLQQKYNLTADEAVQMWREEFGPLANALHGNNTAYQSARLNTAAYMALADQPELQKAFFGRRYGDELEFTKGLMAIGEQKAQAAFEARVKKGEYVSKAQAEKIATAAFNKGRGIAEKAGVPGAQSGNSPNGSAPSGRSDRELMADPNTPLSVLRQIKERQQAL